VDGGGRTLACGLHWSESGEPADLIQEVTMDGELLYLCLTAVSGSGLMMAIGLALEPKSSDD
jgi:hypothetical protein